jgi:hypothetical protein
MCHISRLASSEPPPEFPSNLSVARDSVKGVSSEGREELSALEALQQLERFLDPKLDAFERSCALDDSRIPDGVVVQFLLTLPAESRLEALALTDRHAVLVHWVESQIVEDRHSVACNMSLDPDLQSALVRDTEASVRAALVDNLRLDFDVLAGLLADGSVIVQEALARRFAFLREDDPHVEGDDEVGSDESLSYLYEMVPAVEEEECIEDWERHKHELEIGSLIRATQHADWPAAEGDLGEDADVEEIDGNDLEAEGGWRLSLPQIMGLLAAELGATPLSDDERRVVDR